VNLREDTVELADGRTLREVVETRRSSLSVDDKGNVLLVRQYRLAAEDALLGYQRAGSKG
jgi:hypothetical protein